MLTATEGLVVSVGDDDKVGILDGTDDGVDVGSMDIDGCSLGSSEGLVDGLNDGDSLGCTEGP